MNNTTKLGLIKLRLEQLIKQLSEEAISKERYLNYSIQARAALPFLIDLKREFFGGDGDD